MSCTNYRLTRRRFMQAGAASMATLLGMNVRDLMALSEPTRAKAEHVILLWMSGGMSHIDTFDPKPGRPTAGEFKPIKTTASGIELSEIMPTVAAQMKHAALIRSIAGAEGAHDRASYHLQTGYRMSPQLVHPSIGSVVAHERDQVGDLPSFISVSGRARSAGYLGQACEAYYIGRPGEPDPYLTLPEHLTKARASKRMEILAKMNGRFEAATPHEDLAATDRSYVAANNFMKSPALKAFDLDAEKDGIRDSYGDTEFGRGCLLARRLVDEGVRFVQVSMGGFDTHSDNFNAMRDRGNVIDPAIGSLIGDLAASGKLDKTMVIVLSEFGRTPRINDRSGRDHHPRVFSTLMAGGGIKPGTVVGTSDKDGYAPDERPVQVADIHATVCKALGVDPDAYVSTPLGRQMRLVDGGVPVKELVG